MNRHRGAIEFLTYIGRPKLLRPHAWKIQRKGKDFKVRYRSSPQRTAHRSTEIRSNSRTSGIRKEHSGAEWAEADQGTGLAASGQDPPGPSVRTPSYRDQHAPTHTRMGEIPWLSAVPLCGDGRGSGFPRPRKIRSTCQGVRSDAAGDALGARLVPYDPCQRFSSGIRVSGISNRLGGLVVLAKYHAASLTASTFQELSARSACRCLSRMARGWRTFCRLPPALRGSRVQDAHGKGQKCAG
jgi:hypothetical protein